MTPLISFEEASMAFPSPGGGSVDAVRELSLDVAEGEALCLIGTSGSGKTTALKLINRLHEPTAGRVLLRGEDVAGLDPIRLRRGMGWVIQSGGLFPHLTVAENVGLLCRLEGWEPERVRSRVAELLDLVHMPHDEFGARRPAELSGGQRQRVGVARALALDPPVLLMDEPFGALDPITRSRLREDFAELRRVVGKTVVFVTHDMVEAFAVGDRVALMDAGRLVQVGTEHDFRERPTDAFAARFLAEHFDALVADV